MTWWKRQRAALAALGIAAVAVVGVYAWTDILPASGGDDAAVVSADDEIELAGQTLEVVSVRWDEFDAPDGMRSLSVELRASGGPDAAMCGSSSLNEIGGDREWADARRLLDVPWEAGESSCGAEVASYRILSVFLLPDDASGPFRLNLSGDLGEHVGVVIEP